MRQVEWKKKGQMDTKHHLWSFIFLVQVSSVGEDVSGSTDYIRLQIIFFSITKLCQHSNTILGTLGENSLPG